MGDHQVHAADPVNSERKVLQANEVNQAPLADEVTKASEVPPVSEVTPQLKPKSTRKNPKNEVIPAETAHQVLEEAEVHAAHEDKMANKVHQVILVLTAALANKVLQANADKKVKRVRKVLKVNWVITVMTVLMVK